MLGLLRVLFRHLRINQCIDKIYHVFNITPRQKGNLMSEGIAPRILNFHTRKKSVVGCRSGIVYAQEGVPFTLNSRLSDFQN